MGSGALGQDLQKEMFLRLTFFQKIHQFRKKVVSNIVVLCMLRLVNSFSAWVKESTQSTDAAGTTAASPEIACISFSNITAQLSLQRD